MRLLLHYKGIPYYQINGLNAVANWFTDSADEANGKCRL